MPSSMQPSRHERGLSGDAPVAISVSRAEARLQRELDQSTALLDRVAHRQHMRFARERTSVRSQADHHMRGMLRGVEGMLLPCVLDQHSPNECTSLTPWWQRDLSISGGLEFGGMVTGDGDVTAAEAVAAMGPGKRKSGHYQHRVGVSDAVGGRNTLPCTNRNGKVQPSLPLVPPLKGLPSAPQNGSLPGEKGALPCGFPIPFDASGFQCVTHWAETSFQEVLLTALGPRSERERRSTKEPPNTLLVTVACYLLNEVVSRESKLSRLWSMLKPTIFKAVFAPSALCQSWDLDACDNDKHVPCYPRFESCYDFVDLRLWSDAFLSSTKANRQLSDRNTELQDVVRKSRLVLHLAQRQVDRARLMQTFRAWRSIMHRGRIFRQAATTYFGRLRRRIHLEGCFLRWRRITMHSKVLTLRNMIGESEVQIGLLESANNEAVCSLSAKLMEEQKKNAILEKKKEALKSQLADNHMQTLYAIHSEVLQLQNDLLTEKKQSKRWERLAKTFTCQSNCLDVPPILRKGACTLRLIEADYVVGAPGLQDRVPEARRCLESFLLDWVNFLMRRSPSGAYWRPAVRVDTGMCDGDFDGSALLKFVRTLGSLYTMRGAESTRPFFPSRGCEDKFQLLKQEDTTRPEGASSDMLFTELTRLLGMQMVEGLFPPLLLHCLSLETFFTPSLFCKQPHPTAILWVLASLFVGYARLACGSGPVIAECDLDPDLRCNQGSTLGGYLKGLNSSARSNMMDQGVASSARRQIAAKNNQTVILSNDTVIKKVPPQSGSRSRCTQSNRVLEDEDQSTLPDADRLADTISDLEVYLGVFEEDDGSRPGSTDVHDGNGNDKRSESRSDEMKDTHRSNILLNTGNNTENDDISSNHSTDSLDSEERARRRHVRRNAHLIPPVSALLYSATQKKYVEIHHRKMEQQRLWMGIARLVSSMVVQFRILDAAPPPPPQQGQGRSDFSRTNRSTYTVGTSNAPSELSDSRRKVRKPARLLPSSRTAGNASTNSTAFPH